MGNKSLTSVDYWAFRLKNEPEEVRKLVVRVYEEVGGVKVQIIPTSSGWQGYEKKDLIQVAGKNLGIIAHGGANQRNWVYVGLSGEGCLFLQDVDKANDIIRQSESYQIRRLDIALTVADGSVCHDKVMKAYENGGFSKVGRPPKLSQILPGEKHDGRTIYIGSRSGDRFLRAYEKGYEMLKGYPEAIKKAMTHIDGFPVEKIYRVELELKAKTGALPLDLLENRDRYFAGSYPYLEGLISSKPMTMVITRDKTAQMGLEAVLANIRAQYGSALFTALTVYYGDVSKVMSKIVGNTHSQTLIDAGVLVENVDS